MTKTTIEYLEKSKMNKSDAGKGDRPRPVDRKKWDAWWDEYEMDKKIRELSGREKELQDEGMSVHDILSDTKEFENEHKK